MSRTEADLDALVEKLGVVEGLLGELLERVTHPHRYAPHLSGVVDDLVNRVNDLEGLVLPDSAD